MCRVKTSNNLHIGSGGHDRRFRRWDGKNTNYIRVVDEFKHAMVIQEDSLIR